MSSFLDFPAEVRIEVYQHLFSASQLSVEPEYPSVSHCRRSICSCAFPWHIVNTCQKLRDEALPYLLAATTLQIASASHKAQLLPSNFLASITRAVILNLDTFSKRPLELYRLAALRTLELRNIAVWCHYHDEESLLGNGGEEAMIDMAMFNLKRNSAQLYTLCNTKDRNFGILLFCRYVITSANQETLVSDLVNNGIGLTETGRRCRCRQEDRLAQEERPSNRQQKSMVRLLLKVAG